jgi:hypothetical protein
VTLTLRVTLAPGATSAGRLKRWLVAQPVPGTSLAVPKWMPSRTGLLPPADQVWVPMLVTVSE